MQRTFLRKHMIDDCPKREIRCEYCTMPILAEQERNHLGVCGKVPIECPNGCKKGEVPRNEVRI